MTEEPKYTNGVGYPDLTDMFAQHALRVASRPHADDQSLVVLRALYQELASIHNEHDPDKLITKMGLALAIEPGAEIMLPLSEEAR